MSNKYRITTQVGNNDFILIDELEYGEIVAAKKGLIGALLIEEAFDIVLENFYEHEMELLKCSVNEMLFDNFSDNRFANERNAINRRIINLLSVCRSYMDNGDHHLSSIDSSIMEKAKSNKSHEYDAVLGYRVMEELRNYAQHNSLPIQGYSVNSRWDKNRKKLKLSIEPYLDIQTLEKDNKFKRSVLKDLYEIGMQHNIKPLLYQYISSIFKIHRKNQELVKEHVSRWDKLFFSKIKEFELKYQSSLGLVAVSDNDDTSAVSIISHIINRRLALEAKNKKDLTSLEFWYVSNE